jgi:hypothetical protein
LAIWAVAIFLLMASAMLWESKAGPGPAKLPGSKAPQPNLLLVVVLHSQCPCSLATVENLIDLPENIRTHLSIRLVFTGPNPRNSAVADQATELPNVERQFLSEQVALKDYGARTSGQAYLYDRTGALIFEGGLTGSRGSVGESAGDDAIENAVMGRKVIASAPVYGCALQTPTGI